jgi:Zn-dependent peptidase ImmA (M78 family)
MKITKDRQIEQEANYFAMCLLMPDFLVKIEIVLLELNGFKMMKKTLKILNTLFVH